MSPSNYSAKSDNYFSGARRRFVDDLPRNTAARWLEVGCGGGNTAAYAMAEGKCGWCCGVELCSGPAAEAAIKLQQVIVGDIEKLTLDLPTASFDILILSEVLEHLSDPASVLKKLRGLMKPGAIVMAGSPNVCHASVVRMLLKGDWDYQREGIMDATHLRWFSPRSYRALFEKAGYIVDHVGPANTLHWKARLINKLSLKKFEHLFHSQIYLRAHCD
jgi:2-polyprenyl-3-methyl-5-hydroxy-6-metoxy-1,4-benzoquinol methylase